MAEVNYPECLRELYESHQRRGSVGGGHRLALLSWTAVQTRKTRNIADGETSQSESRYSCLGSDNRFS